MRWSTCSKPFLLVTNRFAGTCEPVRRGSWNYLWSSFVTACSTTPNSGSEYTWKVLCSMRNLILISALSVLAARAQVSSGALEGRVLDASGAPLGETRITATSDATGFVRTAITDPGGAYSIVELKPGSYTVAAQKSGFRP